MLITGYITTLMVLCERPDVMCVSMCVWWVVGGGWVKGVWCGGWRVEGEG